MSRVEVEVGLRPAGPTDDAVAPPADSPSAAARALSAVARFSSTVQPADLPESVWSATTTGLVDLLGAVVAGSSTSEIETLRRMVHVTFARGSATAAGLPGGWAPEAAAYVNSAAGHVFDLDDHNDVVGGHPSVVILPAVLAVAEEIGAPMSAAMAAYVVGVEVEIALGAAFNPAHYERGWHPTATLGCLAATAAVARLLGATEAEIATAIGIAASFASGTKNSFGSFNKPLQVGFAASKAISAARLAVLGASANVSAFDGRYSFGKVFDGVDPVAWSAAAELGRQWGLEKSGLDLKLYPCCLSVHSSIEAALDLRQGESVDPREVESIDVYLHPRRIPHVDNSSPADGTEARFSLQYVMAAALLNGAVRQEDFEDARISDPAIGSLQHLVRVHELEAEARYVPPGRTDCFAARVEVATERGRFTRTVAGHRGYDRSQRVDPQEVGAKFRSLVAPITGQAHAEHALQLLQRWRESDPQVGDLLAATLSPVRERATPHGSRLTTDEAL